jgi:hypothetical protein
VRYRLPSARAVVDRLLLAVRVLCFLSGVALFAGLGWLDAGLLRIWPSWRDREAPARWTSERVTALALSLFPQALAVPCARRRYRVRRLVHPDTLRPEMTAQLELAVQNLSGETWQGGGMYPCRLGVIEPWAGSAFYVAGQWLEPARAAELPEGAEVAPSETVEFRVPIRAPSQPGRYREVWGLVVESRNWIPSLRGIEITVDVRER